MFTLKETDKKGNRVIFSRDDEAADITVYKEIPFSEELTEEEIERMIEDFEEDYSDDIIEFLGRDYMKTEYDREAEELVSYQKELRR